MDHPCHAQAQHHITSMSHHDGTKFKQPLNSNSPVGLVDILHLSNLIKIYSQLKIGRSRVPPLFLPPLPHVKQLSDHSRLLKEISTMKDDMQELLKFSSDYNLHVL